MSKFTRTIWYKNYTGQWTKSGLKATERNLNKIKKTIACNGQADIFTLT